MESNVNIKEQLNDETTQTKKKPFKDLEDQVIKFESATGKNFSEFFNKYHPKLIYYISKICKDDDMAQDLAIESFVSSLEKIENYNNEKAQFSTWLFTIARNATLQRIKDNRRFISMDVKIDENGTSIKDFLSDQTCDDMKKFESNQILEEKVRITKKNIERLKQPYRKVVEMRELKNMTYKDIATELGNDIYFEMNVTESSRIKMPNELSYVTSVVDVVSGKPINDYILIMGDVKRTPFGTHIKLPHGVYMIRGRRPHNLSTLKSQIRNGRMLLEKMVTRDFKKIIDIYGDY